MSEFVLELYVSRIDPAGAEEAAERARVAAEALTGEGTPVRLVRSIFVPEDETCFLLYEAASADLVRAAAARADLPSDRVAEAITEGGTGSTLTEDEGAKT